MEDFLTLFSHMQRKEIVKQRGDQEKKSAESNIKREEKWKEEKQKKKSRDKRRRDVCVCAYKRLY